MIMYIEQSPLEGNLKFLIGNRVPSSASSSSIANGQVVADDDSSNSRVYEAESHHSVSEAEEARVGLLNGSALHSDFKSRGYCDKKSFAIAQPNKSNILVNEPGEEEEEEIEEYTLIDVDEEEEEECDKKANKFKDSEKSSNSISFKVVIEGEGEPAEFIYTPEEQPLESDVKVQELTIPVEQNSEFVHSTASRKRRRIPDSIPIEEFCIEKEKHRRLRSHYPDIYSLDFTNTYSPSLLKPAPPRVLNGSLRSCGSYEPTYKYIFNENEFVNTFENELADYNFESMGISFFEKLKRFLYSKPDNNNEDQQQRNLESRKRRTDQRASLNPSALSQFKYRKVENSFPKVVIPSSEEDGEELSFPSYPSQRESQAILERSLRRPRRSLADMSRRRSLHSIEKPKRKSIFTAPQSYQQIVKNQSYADIEFSDEEDDEVKLMSVGFNAIRNSMRELDNIPSTSSGRIGNKPDAFNIAQQRYREVVSPSSSIPATSLNPATKLSYADAVRQHMPKTGGYMLGTDSSCSVRSVGPSTLRSNPWTISSRSILSQQLENTERQKYQELLEKVIPRGYGNDTTNTFLPSRSTNKRNNKLDELRQRKALQNVDIDNSSSFGTTTFYGLSRTTSHRDNKSQQPLTSTIVLDDDEDFNSINKQKKRTEYAIKKPSPVSIIIDNDDTNDVIDLDDDEIKMVSVCTKEKENIIDLDDDDSKKLKDDDLIHVEPVNTLREEQLNVPVLQPNWLHKWELKWKKQEENIKNRRSQLAIEVEKATASRKAAELEINERFKNFRIDPLTCVIDDFAESEEEPEFAVLTPERKKRIDQAIHGPPDQVVVSKFNLNITRRNIHSLLGLNWLNDEVINFYMNLLMERSENKHESHGLPRVYAMNTFFVTRLMQAGHSGVKRWTRKVDLFAMDVIPVPVHVGGVHWCMAIIHMKNRSIKYYDSMCNPNPAVLNALEQYLKDESLDKRKQQFDTSSFEIESVQDVPRQMNGSDCGVFTCMFAEYITRDKDITFSQQHMEYFRQKMILEIVQGELLQ